MAFDAEVLLPLPVSLANPAHVICCLLWVAAFPKKLAIFNDRFSAQGDGQYVIGNPAVLDRDPPSTVLALTAPIRVVEDFQTLLVGELDAGIAVGHYRMPQAVVWHHLQIETT